MQSRMGWSVSELLFYGGIGIMGTAVLVALIAAAVFRVTGNKLKSKLEQEYGKRQY